MLSIWDPYHYWGKGEDGVRAKAAWRELSARGTGAELGEELTCSRPCSEWAPHERLSRALGLLDTNCFRLGGWERGLG